MARGSENFYGSEGSVPNQQPLQGTGAGPLSVKANPEDFGAQVGQGLEKFGATGEEISQHFSEMAVHTATNDAYVNGYAPQVNNLVSEYKKLSGTEAIQQLPVYQKQLQDLNQKYLSMGSPMQQELMGQLVARHTISTMDNMSNHADQQWQQHEQTITSQSIKNASDDAMNNWQNPDQVEFNVKRAIGLSKLDAQRKIGYDADSQPVVDQLSRESGSQVASSVIDMAIDNRDYTTANMYKNKYGDLLSGKQKLEIEKKLQDVNIANNAANISDNLLTGKPLIPQGTQLHQDVQDKADLAEIAHRNNFDPNIAFALRATESGGGISAGSTRKDAFQTDIKLRDKGFEGDDLESSAHNGFKIWNTNSTDLQTRLGRPLTPSEGYLAYNQGGLGAATLLNAQPTDTAIGALSKIMPPEEAKKHVLDNGGTATMSAKDFSQHVQDMFQTHYNAQKVNNTSPDAIRAQTNIQLPSIQQSSNPHELFNQMNDRLPAAQAAADTITDDNLREATQKQIKLKYEQAKLADTAWKNQQAQKATDIAQDPRYTGMDQIPLSIKQDLQNAGQYAALQKMFDEKNKDPSQKNNRVGDGFLSLFDRIASDDPTDKIADIASLQENYGNRNDVYTNGFKQLKATLSNMSTPEGRATVVQQAQYLNDLRMKMVAGENDIEGKKKFEAALPIFFSQYNNNKENIGSFLSFDKKETGSFAAQLNLPTKQEITSKRIQNSLNTISGLQQIAGQ